jgi:DNA-binding NtrC family response regulator
LLQFPGKTPFSVRARVVRNDDHHRKSARTAISFVDLAADDEDSIHEAIMTALERESAQRSATILVLDHDAPSRTALERDLRALGHQAVGVATPLEALSWLERPDARIATVVVDLSGGPAHGLDVLEFLGAHHPTIQRVVMADEVRPFRLDLALRSGRAHKALRKPWDAGRLAETIGRVQQMAAASRG